MCVCDRGKKKRDYMYIYIYIVEHCSLTTPPKDRSSPIRLFN